MKFKKITAVFIAAVMVVMSLPQVLNAGSLEENLESDFTYAENSTGITITGYTGNGGDVTIPEEIDGKKVTEIGRQAFSSCKSITSVTLPNSVTEIGYRAFVGCTSLTSISVDPDNPTYSSASGVLYSKDGETLIYCPEGKEGAFTIPDGVTKIGENAFDDCESLTSITIPDSVKWIDNYAFYAAGITSITIPNSVTSIGMSAFSQCDSLTSVTIPDSVTSIWGEAFYSCDSLTSISVDPNNPSYASVDGVLYSKNMKTLIVCPAGKTEDRFTIPDGVTKIQESAFTGCKGLTSVTIPNSMTEIGNYAFWGSYIQNITIPDSVTKIGSSAFMYCRSLTSITIPDSVTEIGKYAFDSCYKLASITIPDGVTEIAPNTFSECIRLSSVTIPDSVTKIGDNAFNKCQSLTSITIPDSVTEIGGFAFYFCKSLTSVTIPDGVTKISNGVFMYCENLTSVMIPDSVTEIGNNAFQFSGLTSVTIPDSVTAIGTEAFDRCQSLTSISVDPNNPSYASASGVLYSKDGKTLIVYPAGKTEDSFTVPDGVTKINDIAFNYCEGIKSVTLPNSVTEIGSDAFLWCLKLTSIVIPESVTEITGSRVFYADEVTIYGYAGSRAETYAAENKIPFVDLSLFVPQNIRVDENNNLRWDNVKGANGYEISFAENNSVVKCNTNSYSISELEDGTYTVQIRATSKYGVTGDYSEPFEFIKHDDSLFDKDNEITEPIDPPSEEEEIPESDRIVQITINPAFNMKNKNDQNVELDLTKIKIKAKEIYDEEGLKRAEEALGKEISGNKHYNLLDLTLWEGERDISESYEGLVQVIIPIPAGHRDKIFSCFRIKEENGKAVKEVIPGEQTEDSYIIYLEHFSQYALVADGGESDHTHDFAASEWKSDETNHWKECICGEKSELAEHTDNGGVITTEPTEESMGIETYSCTVCGYVIKTETVEKLEPTHTHDFTASEWKSDETNHWKECICGEKSELAEHTDNGGVITTAPTEESTGVKTYSCTVCGYAIKTETVAKLEPDHTHDFSASEWKSDETNHWKECICGEKSELAEHTDNGGVITTEPTEENTGIKTYSCTVCGYVIKTETVAKLESDHTHDFSASEWKSDETNHWKECICGEKSELAEHTDNGGVITTEPTEESTGIKTYSCTVCGYVIKTETIAKLEPDHTHDFSASEWKSDETNHWKECICGEKSELAEHTDDGGVITTEPTEESTGIKTYSCTVCGYVIKTETVAKLDVPDITSDENPGSPIPAVTVSLGSFTVPVTTSVTAAPETTTAALNNIETTDEANNTTTTTPAITTTATSAANSTAVDIVSPDSSVSDDVALNVGNEGSANDKGKNPNTGVATAVLPVIMASLVSFAAYKKKK